MTKRHVKIVGLFVAKYVGLFKVAGSVTRNRLRILCYHGISVADEHAWRPALYMRIDVFRRRLRHLRDAGYPVLTLGDAMERRANSDLPHRATVITFDDGFKDFRTQAQPALSDAGMPATLYVTSYHAQKQTPIFRLVLSYFFWKSTACEVDLGSIGLLPLDLRKKFDLHQHGLEAKIVWHAETDLSEEERNHLLRDLAPLFRIDLAAILERGMFQIIGANDIREMAANNVQIQLHTHRHRFPTDLASGLRELADNRKFLEPLAGSLKHFCYPSGIWDPKHIATLSAANISSATTCELGLNGPEMNPLRLKRVLDGTQVSNIEFEAEMCGFMDLIRDCRRTLHGLKQGWVRNPLALADPTAK